MTILLVVVTVWLLFCCVRAYSEYRWLGGTVLGSLLLAFGAPLLAPYFYLYAPLSEYIEKKKKRKQ